MNKRYFNLSCLLFICFYSHAQIEYALIENKALYIKHSDQGKEYILSSFLNDNNIYETDVSARSHYPSHFKWHKKAHEIITTTIYGFDRTKSNIEVTCEFTPISQLDSATNRKNILRVIDSLTLVFGEKHIAFNAYLMQENMKQSSFRVRPVLDWLRYPYDMSKKGWMETVLKPTDVDVTYYRDSLFFLQRKDKSIELWYKKEVKEKRKIAFNEDWKRLKVYTTDSTCFVLKYLNNGQKISLVKSYNCIPNSISDKSIFNGSLKLIMQNGHIFIFNLSNGKIYLLSDHISLVGQLQNVQHPNLNFENKALLVEDKDNGCLITAQDIIRYNNNLSFPCIQQYKGKEVETYFTNN